MRSFSAVPIEPARTLLGSDSSALATPHLALLDPPRIEWGPLQELLSPQEKKSIESTIPHCVERIRFHLVTSEQEKEGFSRRKIASLKQTLHDRLSSDAPSIVAAIELNARPDRSTFRDWQRLVSVQLRHFVIPRVAAGIKFRAAFPVKRTIASTIRDECELSLPPGINLLRIERFRLQEHGHNFEFIAAKIACTAERLSMAQEWRRQFERSRGTLVLLSRNAQEPEMHSALMALRLNNGLIDATALPRIKALKKTLYQREPISVPKTIPHKPHPHSDYRQLPWCTIDSPDTRFHEDAFAIVPRPNGGTTLYWSIAEDSYFKLLGGVRGESAHANQPSRSMAHFPLRTDRAGIVLKFVYDPDDRLCSVRSKLGLIRVQHQFTHQEANRLLEEKPSDAFSLLFVRGFKILQARRQERFESQGIVGTAASGNAATFIEEGMGLFNSSLGDLLTNAEVPLLCRTIESPLHGNHQELFDQLTMVGIEAKARALRSPTHFLMLLRRLEDRGAHGLLTECIDRFLSGTTYEVLQRSSKRRDISRIYEFKGVGKGKLNQMQAVAWLANRALPFSTDEMKRNLVLSNSRGGVDRHAPSQTELIEDLLHHLPQSGLPVLGRVLFSEYSNAGKRFPLVKVPGFRRYGIIPELQDQHPLRWDGKDAIVILKGYDPDLHVFRFALA